MEREGRLVGGREGGVGGGYGACCDHQRAAGPARHRQRHGGAARGRQRHRGRVAAGYVGRVGGHEDRRAGRVGAGGAAAGDGRRAREGHRTRDARRGQRVAIGVLRVGVEVAAVSRGRILQAVVARGPVQQVRAGGAHAGRRRRDGHFESAPGDGQPAQRHLHGVRVSGLELPRRGVLAAAKGDREAGEVRIQRGVQVVARPSAAVGHGDGEVIHLVRRRLHVAAGVARHDFEAGRRAHADAGRAARSVARQARDRGRADVRLRGRGGRGRHREGRRQLHRGARGGQQAGGRDRAASVDGEGGRAGGAQRHAERILPVAQVGERVG